MRITRVFFDVDMRQSFEGLKLVAKDAPKGVLFFMNAKRTSFKMLIQDKYIVYYKNDNKRIPLDAIQHLPASFGGTEAEMNQAIGKSLRDKLGIKWSIN